MSLSAENIGVLVAIEELGRPKLEKLLPLVAKKVESPLPEHIFQLKEVFAGEYDPETEILVSVTPFGVEPISEDFNAVGWAREAARDGSVTTYAVTRQIWNQMIVYLRKYDLETPLAQQLEDFRTEVKGSTPSMEISFISNVLRQIRGQKYADADEIRKGILEWFRTLEGSERPLDYAKVLDDLKAEIDHYQARES